MQHQPKYVGSGLGGNTSGLLRSRLLLLQLPPGRILMPGQRGYFWPVLTKINLTSAPLKVVSKTAETQSLTGLLLTGECLSGGLGRVFN